MKRFLSLLMAALFVFLLAACGAQQAESQTPAVTQTADNKIVGICFPNNTDARWEAEATALSQLLDGAGLTALVEYARNDVSLQVSQVQTLIAKPVSCLVIAAIDSLALADVLQQAKQAGIPVIAYDRLLMQTDAVTGYAGFDYQAIGVAMAEHIVKAKQLETAQAENRSHTIEFFMGSPENNNAVLLYTGIQQILKPYLDCGVLVCNTGRTAFEDVYIQNWSAELANTYCENYLASAYPDAPPEILCVASDEIADGCVSALENAQYTLEGNWPLITGLGATDTAMQRLASGQQSMTAQMDFAALPAACFSLIASAKEQSGASWDGPVCDNGTVSVPTRFCTFAFVEES